MKYIFGKLISIMMPLLFLCLYSNVIMENVPDLFVCRRPAMCDVKARQQWIVVHGTYATKAKWYRQGGDFYEELKAALPVTDQVHSFSWSGGITHKARLKAAQELVIFLETHIAQTDTLNIVGHSHGATVAMLAARILKEKNSPYHISKLFTLATPISTEFCKPDMEAIDYLFNIFSFGDLVQPIFGRFKRIYTEHTQIWNIEIKRDEVTLDHSDLHSPEIAHLLPQLKSLVKGNETTVLHLQTDKEHIVKDDFERHKLLALDQKKSKNIFWVSVEGIKRKYPQKILLKAIHISYEKINKKVGKISISRWYNRFWNRGN